MTATLTLPKVSREDASTTQIVKSMIQQASKVATLPAIAAEIIRICDDPEGTVEQLNKVIDPALGVRILKLVNSAYYGVPSQVKSIRHAVLMLGLSSVKNLAIAASLVKMVRGGRIGSDFKASTLWTHSIAVATGARILARMSKRIPADEAFLAGLIHDIGIIVEMQAYRQEFTQILKELDADPLLSFRSAELQTFGITHEDLGAGLCESWNFPVSLRLSTGFHHHPWELDGKQALLPGLVHIADVLAAQIEAGYTRTVEIAEIDPNILEQLNLTQLHLDAVTEMLPESIQETQRLFADDN